MLAHKVGSFHGNVFYNKSYSRCGHSVTSSPSNWCDPSLPCLLKGTGSFEIPKSHTSLSSAEPPQCNKSVSTLPLPLGILMVPSSPFLNLQAVPFMNHEGLKTHLIGRFSSLPPSLPTVISSPMQSLFVPSCPCYAAAQTLLHTADMLRSSVFVICAS